MKNHFKMGLFSTLLPSRVLTKIKEQIQVSSNGQSDVVSVIIGDYGRWQMLMTMLLPLFVFPPTFQLYLPTFTTYSSGFWCGRPDNLSSLPIEYWINYSQPIDACSVRTLPAGITAESIMNNTAPILDSFEKCTDWEYDRSVVGDTIISEWDLVCDRGSLTTIAQVVFLISVGMGGVGGGWISDKFGRKKALMSMMVMQSILAFSCYFVGTYVQFVLVRFALGLVSVAVVFAAFVLTVEMVGGPWIIIAGTFNFMPLPLSYIIVSLVSLILPDWRNLHLALSIPGFFLLLLWFVLPESPRWLLSKGKIHEAKIILRKAAKCNKRDITREDLDKILSSHKTEASKEEPSLLMLFKGYLLKRTFCLFLVWFTMTISYYGLVLNIGKFNLGNLHITSIILAIVEIPAILLSIPILLKTGRRLPLLASMIVCGLACIASEIFTISLNNNWVIISCVMLGKFTISATNVMLPIFTAELYPTWIRNLGVGSSQVATGLALIGVPYLWDLASINIHLPMSVLAVLCIAGGAIVLILPDPSASSNKISGSTNEVCDNTLNTCND